MSNLNVTVVKKENERNFIENPLEIITETVGILPSARDTKQTALETSVNADGIEANDVQNALEEVLQVAKANSSGNGASTAENVSFTSANLNATNVKDALNEVFTQSDSNRKLLLNAIGNPLTSSSTYAEILATILDSKTLLADAIKTKKVMATNSMSFDALANAILLIKTADMNSGGGVSTELKLTDTITATENMAYSIGLTTYLKPSETVAQVYKYIAAQNALTHYQENFNNANASSFIYDKDVVYFDGMARIKDTYVYQILPNGTYFETQEIDFSAFTNMTNAVMDSSVGVFTVTGLKSNAAVVKMNSDIPIDETLLITGMGLSSVTTGNSDVRVAISLNSGLSWQTFDGSGFIDIDIDDADTFKTNGINKATLSAITSEQWQTYRSVATTIRFAYVLIRPTVDDTVGLDMTTMQASAIARWIPAPTSEFEATFDESSQTHNFIFKKANDYKIRYKDKESE